MAKRIVAILIMSLLSLQANAARYDRQCEGISPVLFQKKLKELAHGLRQEMAEPTRPRRMRPKPWRVWRNAMPKTRKRRRREGNMRPIPRSLRCLHSTAVERFSASFSRRAPVGLFMELVY